MFESQEISQRIPVIDASIARMKHFATDGKLENFSNEVHILLDNANELVDTYPDSLAALTEADEIYSSVLAAFDQVTSLAVEFEETKLLIANIRLFQLTPYLSNHVSERNCASMLAGIVFSTFLACGRFFSVSDEAMLKDENAINYSGYVLSMAKAAADNLKRVNPKDPNLSAYEELIEKNRECGFEFHPMEACQIGEYAEGIQDFFEGFMVDPES